MPSAKPILRARIDDVFDVPSGESAVGVHSVSGLDALVFLAGSVPGAALASAACIDFITLHSLYSFPVLA